MTKSFTSSPAKPKTEDNAANGEQEVIVQLEGRLEAATAQCNKYECSVREMEEQIEALMHKNATLETKLSEKAPATESAAPKSVHDELNTLEEVRQGQLCNKCLRNISEEMNHPLVTAEQSLVNDSDQFRASFYYEIPVIIAIKTINSLSQEPFYSRMRTTRPR